MREGACRFGVVLLCAWLGPGCQDGATGVSKVVARADPSSWSTDYCESEGWYGDGECDDFCPDTDSDCDAALETAAKSLLESYTAGYAKAEREMQLAYWDASASGDAGDYQAYSNAQVKIFTFHLDKEMADKLKPLYDARAKLSLFTRRSLEAVEPNYMAVTLPVADLTKLLSVVQMRNDVLAQFNTYRATFDGAERSLQELRDLLVKETDSGRRKEIWEALKGIGPLIAADIVEGVKLGNEVAKTAGHATFWHYSLKSGDLDPTELEALFDEVELRTRAPYAQVKAQIDQEVASRFGIDPGDVQIWHYDQEFFITPPPAAGADLDSFFSGKTKEQVIALAAGFYDKLGMPVDDVVARSDLYQRAGKWPGAFELNVDRRSDIRVMMNARPDQDSMSTALHELGHAVDDKQRDPQLPFLLSTSCHTLTTEAMAMFFEDQSLTPEVLTQVVGADQASVDKMEKAVLEQYRRQELVFARYAVVMFQFEKALYADPTQDLDTLWWDLVEKYQLIKRPAGRKQPDWATKTHISSSPVYYQNYMLGKLFGAQLRASLASATSYDGPLTAFTVLGRPAAVETLKKKVFWVGGRHHWWELIELATGKPLSVEAFAEQTSTPAL